MTDPRTLYSPERDFYRSVSRDAKSTGLQRVLYRGLVTFVDRLGSTDRPRFSIQAKITGIDDTSDTGSGRFFPPLLPLQMMAVPEVGEEILLLCEEVGNINSAFWISRANATNLLTKIDFGTGVKDQIDTSSQKSSSQYGFEGSLPKESSDKTPNEKYVIPDPRVKPGDVVNQGRSNTFDRHTFDSKNKKGYVETITEEQEVPDSSFYKDDFRSSLGSRSVLATKSDLDTQIIEEINKLNFDGNFLAGKDGSVDGYPTYDKPYKIDGINTTERSKNKYDAAYLLLEALELRFVSRQGKNVQHTVLAEEQERWLILLINITKDLIDDINLYRQHVDELRADIDTWRSTSYELHQHMANGPTSPPLNPALNASSNTFKSALQKAHTSFEEDKQKLEKDKEDYEKHKQPIPIHHSKTVAIN